MDNTQQRTASETGGAPGGAETATRLAIESNPAHSSQSVTRPAGNAPWLPISADGDPRPWPIFVLTSAQQAQFLADQPTNAAPLARGQPAPTSRGGSPTANPQPRVARAQVTGVPQGAPGPTFHPAPGPTYAPPRPQPYVQAPPGGIVHPAPPPAVRNVGQGLAITSLVLGLVALVFTCGSFGWLPGVPGFIVGMVALNKYHPMYSSTNMKAIAGWGIGLSIVASVVSLVLFIAVQSGH